MNPEDCNSTLKRRQAGFTIQNAPERVQPVQQDCIHELGRIGLNTEPLSVFEKASRTIGNLANKAALGAQRWFTTKK